MLDNLYENIGSKIKNLAKWIFIIEAIGAVITGLVLLFTDKDYILYGFLTMICGPIVAWVSSWVLYAFGELVEKTCNNEAYIKNINIQLEQNKIEVNNNDTSSTKTTINNEYEINENGCIIQNGIFKKYNGRDNYIIIPENITTIGEQAFSKRTSLVSITIPNGVTTICEWAFYNCQNLEKINISDSVTNIGKYSFYGCNNIKIHAPAGSYAEQYAKENNIPFVAE